MLIDDCKEAEKVILQQRFTVKMTRPFFKTTRTTKITLQNHMSLQKTPTLCVTNVNPVKEASVLNNLMSNISSFAGFCQVPIFAASNVHANNAVA